MDKSRTQHQPPSFELQPPLLGSELAAYSRDGSDAIQGTRRGVSRAELAGKDENPSMQALLGPEIGIGIKIEAYHSDTSAPDMRVRSASDLSPPRLGGFGAFVTAQEQYNGRGEL